MLRVLSLTAVASVLSLALVGCGSDDEGGSGAPSGDTLTFGAALSLTGKLSREGTLTREGYDYCKQVINAKGGVKLGDKSYQLAIDYQDDQSTPDVAAQLVDQMNGKGRKIILGPYGSASTEAAAAVVERNKQVMIDSAGADDKIFSKGYEHTFAVLSPASEYLSSIVKAASETTPKPKTVAIVSADDGFSKTAAAAGKKTAEKLGMTVVAVEYVPNGTTNVSAALTKIRPKKPDLLLGSVHLAEGVAIMKQSQELGLNPSGGFGMTVAPPTPDFAKTLGKAANGVLGSSQWTAEVPGKDATFGTAKEYAAGFTKAFKHAPQYHNAEATAACLAAVLAIKDAGSTDPAKVRDAVADLDVSTFFGQLKFDAEGKNVTKPMSVIQIQGGKIVTVWPKGAGTKAIVWPTPPFGKR
jgi:branched-chain amino acid transport system substrate-binding protein